VVQILERTTFFASTHFTRIIFFINKNKKPNIAQIDSRLSGQRTSILFQRSQVQIPEWATFLQFKHI
jgi:hypothetical protein